VSGAHFQRKLMLERPVRTADGAGGFDVTWEVLGTLWADMRPKTGREPIVSAQSSTRQPWAISVRGAPAGSPRRPNPSQRFREGARVFNILSVAESDPKGRYLLIQAEEGAAV